MCTFKCVFGASLVCSVVGHHALKHTHTGESPWYLMVPVSTPVFTVQLFLPRPEFGSEGPTGCTCEQLQQPPRSFLWSHRTDRSGSPEGATQHKRDLMNIWLKLKNIDFSEKGKKVQDPFIASWQNQQNYILHKIRFEKQKLLVQIDKLCFLPYDLSWKCYFSIYVHHLVIFQFPLNIYDWISETCRFHQM